VMCILAARPLLSRVSDKITDKAMDATEKLDSRACPGCGARVPLASRFCPSCGRQA
jgi:predicted amidophosphoribosyltransferase